MRLFLLIILFFLLGCSPDSDPDLQIACPTCDFVVNEHETNGESLGIKPGQTICLDGSQTYGPLLFKEIKGTAENPILIRNCNGTCRIYSQNSFGVKFEDSEHFKFYGTSTKPGDYGIIITTESGFYLTLEDFTTDFEIYRIEVRGEFSDVNSEKSGFAGIGVKTSPYTACDLFADSTREAWIMKNVRIHDNYIHHVGGEGLYIGHGFYKGRKETECSEITYSHSIRGLYIYDNVVENVGYDGLQIKNADKDVEVHNNKIRNYGLKKNGVHNEGLFIGEGTTGRFYNNIIEEGSGNGIQFQGLGNNDIFNNIIINPGENGFYGTLGEYAVRLEDGYINILNNTIYKDDSFSENYAGITFHNELGGQKRIINNMVVTASGEFENISINLENSTNLLTNEKPHILGIIQLKLENKGINKLYNDLSELGTDIGVDLTALGVVEDINGVSRPQGRHFDIGAFEN